MAKDKFDYYGSFREHKRDSMNTQLIISLQINKNPTIYLEI